MTDPDELDPEELCEKAHREPDEIITKFVLEDYASALIQAGIDEDAIVRELETVDLYELGDSLCDASHWSEIFEAHYEAGRA